ncbi:unnamed protein product [Lota lota]
MGLSRELNFDNTVNLLTPDLEPGKFSLELFGDGGGDKKERASAGLTFAVGPLASEDLWGPSGHVSLTPVRPALPGSDRSTATRHPCYCSHCTEIS